MLRSDARGAERARQVGQLRPRRRDASLPRGVQAHQRHASARPGQPASRLQPLRHAHDAASASAEANGRRVRQGLLRHGRGREGPAQCASRRTAPADRQLALLFAMNRVILIEFDIAAHVDALFDICFCYFPIVRPSRARRVDETDVLAAARRPVRHHQRDAAGRAAGLSQCIAASRSARTAALHRQAASAFAVVQGAPAPALRTADHHSDRRWRR